MFSFVDILDSTHFLALYGLRNGMKFAAKLYPTLFSGFVSYTTSTMQDDPTWIIKI